MKILVKGLYSAKCVCVAVSKVVFPSVHWTFFLNGMRYINLRFTYLLLLKRFDAVGWTTERSSGLSKVLAHFPEASQTSSE